MRLRNLAGVALCVAIFMACGYNTSDNTDPNGNDPGGTAQEQTALTILHASPDTPELDAYIDGKLSATVSFKGATGYLNVAAGAHKIELRTHGADLSVAALVSVDVNVDLHAKVILTLCGHLDVSLKDSLRLTAHVAAKVDLGAVQVRLLNAVLDVDDLRVSLDAKVKIDATAYGKLSALVRADADIAAGALLKLRLLGLDVDAAVAVLADVLVKGHVYTAVCLGEILPTAADDRFLSIVLFDEITGKLITTNLKINVDANLKASLYLFHGALDADGLDLAVAGQAKLVSNLGYQKASALVELAAGVHDVELRNAVNASVLLKLRLKLLPGISVALCAHGRVAVDLRLAACLKLRLGGGIRVVNLVPDLAAGLDLSLGAKVIVKGLAYARVSAAVDLDLILSVLDKLHIDCDNRALFDALLSVDLVALLTGKTSLTLFVTGAADVRLGKKITVVAVADAKASVGSVLDCIPLLNLL